MHEFLHYVSAKDALTAAPTTTLSTLLQSTAKNSNNNLPLMDQLSLFEQILPKQKVELAEAAENSSAALMMSMAPKKPADRRPASARFL